MIDISHLAQQAIDMLTPALRTAEPFAGKAVGGFAEKAGAKLFGVLSEMVEGKPAEATLKQAAKEPDNELPLEILKLQLQDLARSDSTFCERLQDKLHELAQPSIQTATVSGNNNSIIQTAGTKNNVRIG